eukprot:891988-Prorocentrum_minimum.AAC.2
MGCADCGRPRRCPPLPPVVPQGASRPPPQGASSPNSDPPMGDSLLLLMGCADCGRAGRGRAVPPGPPSCGISSVTGPPSGRAVSDGSPFFAPPSGARPPSPPTFGAFGPGCSASARSMGADQWEGPSAVAEGGPGDAPSAPLGSADGRGTPSEAMPPPTPPAGCADCGRGRGRGGGGDEELASTGGSGLRSTHTHHGGMVVSG